MPKIIINEMLKYENARKQKRKKNSDIKWQNIATLHVWEKRCLLTIAIFGKFMYRWKIFR